MKQATSENLEMTIALPLGVVANQLIRIEADLRLLNMKVLDSRRNADNQGLAGRIEARLENINEALDSIRNLVSDMEGCIRPTPDDTRSSRDAAYRKPYPERDD